MSVSYGRGAAKKAAMLHSKIVRARVGRCIICSRTDSLQAAHIVRRTYGATRTDLSNAWCLCAKDHFRIDRNPDEFMALVHETIGLDAYYALKKKAQEGVRVKVDWPAELERLQEIAASEGIS